MSSCGRSVQPLGITQLSLPQEAQRGFDSTGIPHTCATASWRSLARDLRLSEVALILGFACLLLAQTLSYLNIVESGVYYAVLVCYVMLVVGLARKERLRSSFVDRNLGCATTVVKPWLIAVGFSAALTVVVEIWNVGAVQGYSVLEVAYLLLPLGVGVGVACFGERLYHWQMDLFAVKYVVQFIAAFGSKGSLSSLSQISWESSQSPFESSMAHELFLLEVYFLSRRRYGVALLFAVLTILSLKRMSAILAVLVVFFVWYLRRPKRFRKLPEVLLVAAGLAGTALVSWVSLPRGREWLSESLGVEVSSFDSGRSVILGLVRVNGLASFGLGSVNASLGEFVTSQFGTTWNGLLHNDTLRLYYEVTFVGLLLFLIAVARLGSSNRWAYLICCYVTFVLVTSRLLTYAPFWMVFFSVTIGMQLYGPRRSRPDKAQAEEVRG